MVIGIYKFLFVTYRYITKHRQSFSIKDNFSCVYCSQLVYKLAKINLSLLLTSSPYMPHYTFALFSFYCIQSLKDFFWCRSSWLAGSCGPSPSWSSAPTPVRQPYMNIHTGNYIVPLLIFHKLIMLSYRYTSSKIWFHFIPNHRSGVLFK